MARIRTGIGMLSDLPPISLQEGKLTEVQLAYVTDALRSIIKRLNGLLTVGDASKGSQSGNLDGQFIEFTFVLANTDYVIPHDLERVPIGFILMDVNVDGAVVRGTNRGSWGSRNFQLRCSQASTTALLILV